MPVSSPPGGSGQTRRVLVAVLLIATVNWVGAVGYRLIEGWSWLDSFYMVLITLSTVGYGEVQPLSTAGRIWTFFVIGAGVGMVGYAVSIGIEFILEGNFTGIRRKRRMAKHIADMKDHYIICGYGRVGRQVTEAFRSNGKDVVVIEQEDMTEVLDRHNIPHIVASAQDESALFEAGIERAASLVAAVDSDTENVFITLTARVLNPKIRVIARASNADAVRKLMLVGANRVVSPYVESGRRMAQLALTPGAVDFFEFLLDPNEDLAVEMHQVEITPGSALDGKTLRELDLSVQTGVMVVAVRSGAGSQLNPDPSVQVQHGDMLLVLGSREQCAAVDAMNMPAAEASH